MLVSYQPARIETRDGRGREKLSHSSGRRKIYASNHSQEKVSPSSPA